VPSIFEIVESVRLYQSKGQALLYRFVGVVDAEKSAQGSWVTGESGRRYLDLGGFGVFLLGHQHPGVIAKVSDQLSRLSCSSRWFPTAVGAEAAAMLVSIAPPGLSKVMFLNSGSEAAEAAAKLCRAATGRIPLCHIVGSYHGKTFGALSLTDNPNFRNGLGPLVAEVHQLPRDGAQEAGQRIRALRPAGVFIEPIQGEGGIVEVPIETLRQIRAACSEVGALMVVDEIQCGLGRTGDVWAISHADVQPDILLSGKSLGGGVLPVSALLATSAAFGPYDHNPLLHTSTFGGNPLACAAVVATVKAIVDEQIPQKAKELGGKFKAILEELHENYADLFIKVSGRGLMLGLHCVRPDIAANYMQNCAREGVLLTPCIAQPHVLRVSPSALTTADELDFCRGAVGRAASLTRSERMEMDKYAR
jgi:putrescine aminotransferase